MEYLDIYDDEGNFLGKEERGIVHEKGLWHKTVHCWLYTKDGYVFFQRRADSHTLYTTASGHLRAGETINEGFHREIKEEIGCSIDTSDAKLLRWNHIKWIKLKMVNLLKIEPLLMFIWIYMKEILKTLTLIKKKF